MCSAGCMTSSNVLASREAGLGMCPRPAFSISWVAQYLERLMGADEFPLGTIIGQSGVWRLDFHETQSKRLRESAEVGHSGQRVLGHSNCTRGPWSAHLGHKCLFEDDVLLSRRENRRSHIRCTGRKHRYELANFQAISKSWCSRCSSRAKWCSSIRGKICRRRPFWL